MESRLKSILKKPLIVFSHSDADGIASLVLFQLVFLVRRFVFPLDFGACEYVIEKTGEVLVPDVMLDMRPSDPTWSGLCIDHHPGHPEERGYHLIWRDVPTGLILFDLLKEQMPRKYWWKLVCCLVGEGQPELIPTEVWDSCPSLFDEVVTEKSTWRERKFLVKTPVWMKMSSPNNYGARHAQVGPVGSYRALKVSETPHDLLDEPSLRTARDIITEEVNQTMRDLTAIECVNHRVIFAIVDSENTIQTLIAYRLSKEKGKATLVVNKHSGLITVRGILTTWLRDKLKPLGFVLEGHPGFMGGKLKEDQSVEDLKRAILSLKW